MTTKDICFMLMAEDPIGEREVFDENDMPITGLRLENDRYILTTDTENLWIEPGSGINELETIAFVENSPEQIQKLKEMREYEQTGYREEGDLVDDDNDDWDDEPNTRDEDSYEDDDFV